MSEEKIELTDWQEQVLDAIERGHQLKLPKHHRGQVPSLPLYESVAAATAQRATPFECARRRKGRDHDE